MLTEVTQLNRGPFQNDFTFMNGNLNSLSDDNFERVHMSNAIFNCDVISLCETIPILLSYKSIAKFITSNNPTNTRHQGRIQVRVEGVTTPFKICVSWFYFPTKCCGEVIWNHPKVITKVFGYFLSLDFQLTAKYVVLILQTSIYLITVRTILRTMI